MFNVLKNQILKSQTQWSLPLSPFVWKTHVNWNASRVGADALKVAEAASKAKFTSLCPVETGLMRKGDFVTCWFSGLFPQLGLPSKAFKWYYSFAKEITQYQLVNLSGKDLSLCDKSHIKMSHRTFLTSLKLQKRTHCFFFFLLFFVFFFPGRQFNHDRD